MPGNDKIQSHLEEKRRKLAELKARRVQRAVASLQSRTPAPHALGTSVSVPLSASVLDQVTMTVGADRNAPVLSASFPQAMHTIIPQEKHMYDKECQTEIGVKLEGTTADMEKEMVKQQQALMEKEEKLKILMEQLKIDKQRYDRIREAERLREPRELSSEEQKRVESSSEFKNFFSRASRIVERALSRYTYDVTIDYADEGISSRNQSGDESVREIVCFTDKRVRQRAVTSIGWSPRYPELLLASYAGQDDPISFVPDGTVLVWNTQMPNRPEYAFTCNVSSRISGIPQAPFLCKCVALSGQILFRLHRCMHAWIWDQIA